MLTSEEITKWKKISEDDILQGKNLENALENKKLSKIRQGMIPLELNFLFENSISHSKMHIVN